VRLSVDPICLSHIRLVSTYRYLDTELMDRHDVSSIGYNALTTV